MDSKDNYEIDFEDMTPPQFLHAGRKAVRKTKFDPSRGRATLQAMIDWVDNNPIRFGPESAMGKMVDLIMRFDDDEELDDDDVSTFMRLIGEFFKVITATDISDAENWEARTNMSPNLLKLLGCKAPPKNDSDQEPNDWKAPSKAGMSNSDAAVPTEKNSYKEPPKPVPEVQIAEAKHAESQRKASKSHSVRNDEDDEEQPQDEEGQEDEEGEEEDEDYDYDDDDDEEEESRPAPGKFVSIMRSHTYNQRLVFILNPIMIILWLCR